MEYPKNYILLKQGKVCTHLWFLVNGAARYYYTDDTGKETNVWFTFENDVITETSAFVRQDRSQESIQLLEPCEMFAIHYNQIQALLKKHHAFALWYIHLIEKYYVPQLEDRIGDLQFLSAKGRYEKLLTKFPEITNRISLGYIASYLNITQETLSRIRAGK